MYTIYILINNINGDFMIDEIMSKKIIFANTHDSVKKVSKLMKDNNIGFIPIKDNGEFVGVITDRDLCLSIPSFKSLNDPVKSYITNNVISIDINSSIDDALNIMSKYKVKRIMIKEKDNTVGVLSLSDILNYTDNNSIIKTYKAIFYIHDNKLNNIAQIDEFYL